ncbi:MAG TPA: ABC transporter ATP-binding protein [Caulobacteraceae bacterium]|jgi:ATP-binding cassette subfamily B protein|nr:ABC transporter ATP-binding protein [Caulobacteraceae bacterium]
MPSIISGTPARSAADSPARAAAKAAASFSQTDHLTPKGSRWTRWRKFLSYYRPHIGLLVADLACAVLVSATALALPLCANWVVKHLSATSADPRVIDQILVMGGFMLALLAVQALSTLFVDYQGHVMGAKMESAMRQELFEHYQALSFGFYDQQRVGQLMSRISSDLFSLSELYHHGPEDLAIAVLKFGGALIILFRLDPPLTWLILAAMPFAAAYSFYFNGRMNRALRQAKQQIGAINERVEDSLSGIRVVKSFANEALEVGRFADQNARFLETRRFGYKSEAWFSAGLATFAQLITVTVIVVGAMRVRAASLGVADLLTYLLCVAILVDPIARLVNITRLWQEGLTGFHRFMDVLDIQPDIQDRPGARPAEPLRGAISIRRVSFRYPQSSRPVLDKVSLDIRAGEFVALIGYSGVGKTTLCSLIPRFYDVQEGAVLIDGQDVRDITLASLRRGVGLVQQDVYLFAGTVAENIGYGRPGAERAEIVEAARRAHAHDFIMALPQGYDSDIGQRGVKLSGGQKQRLTIARVFLKDPPILVFDEATSALDTESERAVQAALHELARGRTTLVIAHRLSTIRHANRIVVLTDAGVAEQGSHEALLARGGAYAALHSAQASL